MMMKTGYLAVLLAAAAGCSQEAVPPPAAAAEQESPEGEAMFSMVPDSFQVCDTAYGAIKSTAKWDVTGQRVAKVAIFVVDAKGERKLWLNGGATGQSTTGEWVFPDSTFQLVSQATGRSIAEVVVKGSPCS